MAATYKDIQKKTGLSLATISKYFNGGTVRAENKQLIETAIKELDFHVNEYARSLKSRKSHIVGGLIPELTSTFNTSMMADVETFLRQRGYGFMVCDCRLDGEMEKEELDFLLDRMVDGIITIPYSKSGKVLSAATERNVPVVLIDRLTLDFQTDAVLLDNRHAAELAAEEFIKKGHQQLAVISGPTGLYTSRERLQGFVAYLNEHQIPVREDWLIYGPSTVEAGYREALSLLQKPDRPTGIFMVNYEITLGTIMAINELGLRIPEDISLIGFDNLTLSGVIKPKLTMLMQPMEALAYEAASLLIARMKGTAPSKEKKIVSIKAQLVEGESVMDLKD